MATGTGSIDQQWCEPVHPAVQGDLVDFDPALREEFLDIAIRQAEPEMPPHRKDDHLRRKPGPRAGDGGGIDASDHSGPRTSPTLNATVPSKLRAS